MGFFAQRTVRYKYIRFKTVKSTGTYKCRYDLIVTNNSKALHN